jgi:hypothetical protein
MSSGGGGGGINIQMPEIPKDPFKELEQSAQRIAGGVGALASGNFNNAGTLLVEGSAAAMTGGLSAAGGLRAGETPAERATREAMEAARQAEQQANVQLEQDRRRRVNSLVESSAAARMSTPGAAQTLLTAGYGGSLLTQRRS